MFRLITRLNVKNFDKPYILEDDLGTQRAITVEQFNELVDKGKVVTRHSNTILTNLKSEV